MANGVTEKLLTGDAAAKVKAAALAAVPAGPSSASRRRRGSPYEAHVTRSDGTEMTVKVDSNFKVTSTETDRR